MSNVTEASVRKRDKNKTTRLQFEFQTKQTIISLQQHSQTVLDPEFLSFISQPRIQLGVCLSVQSLFRRSRKLNVSLSIESGLFRGGGAL